MPFTDVLNHDKTFKTPDELQMLFKLIGINEKEGVVFTCQRGITACILEAAYNDAGFNNSKVYDGSYEEYGGKRN